MHMYMYCMYMFMYVRVWVRACVRACVSVRACRHVSKTRLCSRDLRLYLFTFQERPQRMSEEVDTELWRVPRQ